MTGAYAFAVAIALAASTMAEPYCSLIVRVVDYEDREVNADITVIEASGRTIQRGNEPGGARFCDLGIMPAVVKVGGQFCGVTHSVPLEWMTTRTIKIAYDPSPCLYDPPPSFGRACTHLLRIVRADKKPLVAVLNQTSPTKRVYKSDEFGRALVNGKVGTPIAIEIKAEGFSPKNVIIGCNAEEPREQEITLEQVEKKSKN